MKTMDINIELAYVSNVPHLASMRNVNGLNWNNGLVEITATDIWLPTDNGFEIIPLKSIEVVGREMPEYMVKQICKITKHKNVLAIDYKKKSVFSSAFVSYTMLFAGNSKNIAELSNSLISLIGFKIDAIFADIKPAESRLLCLIAAGIDNLNMLNPIFNNNRKKLNHAFVVLKKKGLVDDYASATQLGFEYVEQIKGKEGGVIGSNEKESENNDFKESGDNDFKESGDNDFKESGDNDFKESGDNDFKESGDNDFKESAYITNADPTKKMNKYTWEYKNSLIDGLVATSELLQCIPIDDVDEVEIEDVKLGTKRLHIHTKYDAHIYIEPEDKLTIFILCVALDKNKDPQLRILCSMYLGLLKPDELAHIVNMPASLLVYKLDDLKDKGYIHSNNKLSSKSTGLIRDMVDTIKRDNKSSEIPGLLESIEMNRTENNTNDEFINS